MKNHIKEFFTNLKKRINNSYQIIRHPSSHLADFILRLYGYNKDKIPLPLLKFLIDHLGGWAGVSIYLTWREYKEEVKRSKRQKIVTYYILPLTIILVIFLSGIQKSDNFLFGFAQNLLSDIILILLVIYILPLILNKPKNYKVSLENKCLYSREEKLELIFSIKNTGEEVFKKEEVHWEIFVPSGDLLEDDIAYIDGAVEANSDEILLPMWKFTGLNKTPLFIDQEIIIARIFFRTDILSGTQYSPYKIYLAT
jgi:hypothetical protein